MNYNLLIERPRKKLSDIEIAVGSSSVTSISFPVELTRHTATSFDTVRGIYNGKIFVFDQKLMRI